MTGEHQGARGNRRGGGRRRDGEAGRGAERRRDGEAGRGSGRREPSRAGGQREAAGTGGKGGSRGAGATRKPPRPSHSLSLTVSGKGMELHCDTCDLVVGRLAGPQVRSAVEAAHRRHRTALEWESGWVGTCTCGWRTGRVKQDVARQMAADHESEALQTAARGTG